MTQGVWFGAVWMVSAARASPLHVTTGGGSMRILWTLFKIIVGLAIAIPVGILAIALTFGVVGTLIGLAVLALKLACLAFVGYGLFRVGRFMLAPAPKPVARPIRELPSADPYYEAAMRELDSELGRPSRS